MSRPGPNQGRAVTQGQFLLQLKDEIGGRVRDASQGAPSEHIYAVVNTAGKYNFCERGFLFHFLYQVMLETKRNK